jgi:hypothetical protein
MVLSWSGEYKRGHRFHIPRKERAMKTRSGNSGFISIVGGMAAIAMIASGCGSSGGTGATTTSVAAARPASELAPIHGKYSPTVDPANFVQTVDNTYWPLEPGTTYHYKGVRGTTPQTDDEAVTNRKKRILGIPATVVRDVVSEHGTPVERTLDYYAQDKQGNVWYLGEDSFETNAQGKMVRASDSWLSGVKGGKPGIIMPGDPKPGEAYRQEYYPPGEALDEARVLSLDGTTTVPYGGRHTGLLVTSERSPLEPQTEQKYYAPGLGEVMEKVVKGHHEEFRLVDVTH